MELTRGQLDALVRQARDGDAAAKNQVLQHFRPRVKQLAEEAIGPEMLAHVDPSDVTQETYLYVAKSFARFRGQTAAEFEAWLRKIVLNKVRDRVRHVHADVRDIGRQVSFSDGSRSGPDLVKALLDDGSTPGRKAMLREKLSRAIDSIRVENREVVRLHVWQRLEAHEIAERLGLPLEAVAPRLARGLRTLDQRWKDLDDDRDESAT